MVHNGIEYADMQLIAESYDILRSALGIEPVEIAEIFREWNAGDLESFLIEITVEVLGLVDVVDRPAVRRRRSRRRRAEGHRSLDRADRARARHAGERDRRGGVRPRAVRSRRAARAGRARRCPATDETWDVPDRDAFVEDVRRALYASKVIAYAQGFDMIRAGAVQYEWDIDLGAMATIWRGGCIIRARFLDRIREAYDENADLPSLVLAPYFQDAITNGQDGWRRVVAGAARAGIPAPGFGSALAYYDGLRRERSPAALIQGLRDLFGAHTYQRVDREGAFHVQWAVEGRPEVEVERQGA